MRQLTNIIKKGLGMKPMRVDAALYYLLSEVILEGLSGFYLDDILHTYSKAFWRHLSITNKAF